MTRVGVIVALAAEARCFTHATLRQGQIVRLSEQSILLVSGIGARRASAAAQHLVKAGVGALVSAGTAAALREDLRAGTVLLPSTLVADSGKRIGVTLAWRNRVRERINAGLRVEQGDLGEAMEIVSNANEKIALGQRLSVVAGDMESVAIAKVAVAAGIPVLVCRTVVDSAKQRVPACVLAACDSDGEVRTPKLAMELLRHLGEVPALLSLGIAFGRSRRTLKCLARDLSPDFAFEVTI